MHNTKRMLSTGKIAGGPGTAVTVRQLTDVPLLHHFGLRWRSLARASLAAGYVALIILPAWCQATAKPDNRHSHHTSVHRHVAKAAKDDAGGRQDKGTPSQPVKAPAAPDAAAGAGPMTVSAIAAPEPGAQDKGASSQPVQAPVPPDAAAGTGSMTVSATAAPEPGALPQHPLISSPPTTNEGSRAPTLANSETSPSALDNVALLSGMAGGALAIAIGAAAARRYIASPRTPAPRCEVEDGEELKPLRGLAFGRGRDRQRGPVSG